ncbi:hypothetical protein LOK49_LG01G00810, partial [Camellia lanceoleosa]
VSLSLPPFLYFLFYSCSRIFFFFFFDPQGDYIELHRKRHGYRHDHFKRKHKKEACKVHKRSQLAQKKDLVMYEMNIRAFMADESTGQDPSIHGSYLGVIEMRKIFDTLYKDVSRRFIVGGQSLHGDANRNRSEAIGADRRKMTKFIGFSDHSRQLCRRDVPVSISIKHPEQLLLCSVVFWL